jgi:hypothetical protein
MTLPIEAIDLVVDQEVSGQGTYTRLYQSTTWPGGGSGVTVAIGYDLGQVTTTEAHADWSQLVDDATLDAMLRVVGHKGSECHSLAEELRGVVVIPWATAMAEFENREIPKWIRSLSSALPRYGELPPDCAGALWSLAYNRGLEFHSPGDRYKEMRAIATDVARWDLADIPAQIRSMKRLWVHTGLGGLVKRREAEAVLFERGLSSRTAPVIKA